MHRKPHSGVEQCESTVLAPAPAWRKCALALETGQHGPGLQASGLCAMLGQGGVEYGEGKLLGCMALGLCCHATLI